MTHKTSRTPKTAFFRTANRAVFHAVCTTFRVCALYRKAFTLPKVVNMYQVCHFLKQQTKKFALTHNHFLPKKVIGIKKLSKILLHKHKIACSLFLNLKQSLFSFSKTVKSCSSDVIF